MPDKVYIVEGRQFRTENDRKLAERDKIAIDKLRERMKTMSLSELKSLLENIKSEKIKFYTMLGQDFRDELEEAIRAKEKGGDRKHSAKKSAAEKKTGPKAGKRTSGLTDAQIEAAAKELLRQQEKRRKRIVLSCILIAAFSLGYFGLYTFHEYRTSASYNVLTNLKENALKEGGKKPSEGADVSDPVIHYTEDGETPEVLEEYKNLLNKNKKLIGWLQIADTNIDFPVMQTSDNEYYLNHNINQEKDKNGTIFMDTACDVLKPSTNYILYGHHMRSGAMFGKLDLYEKQSYYEDHPKIRFDTIYQHGTYQVMYVFRDHVRSADDVSFKYYQFIDANSEIEFDSYMNEMAGMSLYDTGVTAQYGDHLLTLSTCDYEEENGRFVVVAKRIE